MRSPFTSSVTFCASLASARAASTIQAFSCVEVNDGQAARGLDPLHRVGDGGARRTAFRGKRHQRGGIAQRRAVVGAAGSSTGCGVIAVSAAA